MEKSLCKVNSRCFTVIPERTLWLGEDLRRGIYPEQRRRIPLSEISMSGLSSHLNDQWMQGSCVVKGADCGRERMPFWRYLVDLA